MHHDQFYSKTWWKGLIAETCMQFMIKRSMNTDNKYCKENIYLIQHRIINAKLTMIIGLPTVHQSKLPNKNKVYKYYTR